MKPVQSVTHLHSCGSPRHPSLPLHSGWSYELVGVQDTQVVPELLLLGRHKGGPPGTVSGQMGPCLGAGSVETLDVCCGPAGVEQRGGSADSGLDQQSSSNTVTGELVPTARHIGTIITSFLQMQKCGRSMFSKLLKVKVTSKQETRGGAQTQTARCCLPGPGPVLGGSHRPADQGVWFHPNLHGVCLTSESPNIMEMQYSREQSSLWSLGL